MKRLILLYLLLVPVMAFGNVDVHLEHVNIDLSDKPSLQRGAK